MFIDSHCHLSCDAFKNDLENVLSDAILRGVLVFLNVCTSFDDALRMKSILDRKKCVFGTIGIHPKVVENQPNGEFYYKILGEWLLKYSVHRKIIGIGETGLDLRGEITTEAKERQYKSFIIHAGIAIESGLPLVIHTRNAEEETISLIKSVGGGKMKGVIHCFSGTLDFAKRVIDLGFYLSISGLITFKGSDTYLSKVVEGIPENRLLLETDSPFLSPTPYRGKRNEPSFIIHTAEAVARIKRTSVAEIARITSRNFLKLFSKVLD